MTEQSSRTHIDELGCSRAVCCCRDCFTLCPPDNQLTCKCIQSCSREPGSHREDIPAPERVFVTQIRCREGRHLGKGKGN